MREIQRPLGFQRRSGTLFAVAVIVILILLLVSAVAWRLSEVSKVSGWTHLVRSFPEAIEASAVVVEGARETMAEARDQGFKGEELLEVEKLVDRSVELMDELSELEEFRTVREVANDESPLAVMDPHAEPGGPITEEVVIEQPESYEDLLVRYSLVRYELEEASDRLEEACHELNVALQLKRDVEEKQEEWEETRRTLAATVKETTELSVALVVVVPAAWHETTKAFEDNLADANRLLEEKRTAPKDLAQLGTEINAFKAANASLKKSFEALQVSVEAELLRAWELEQAAANQEQADQVEEAPQWDPPFPGQPDPPVAPTPLPPTDQPPAPPTPPDPNPTDPGGGDGDGDGESEEVGDSAETVRRRTP